MKCLAFVITLLKIKYVFQKTTFELRDVITACTFRSNAWPETFIFCMVWLLKSCVYLPDNKTLRIGHGTFSLMFVCSSFQFSVARDCNSQLNLMVYELAGAAFNTGSGNIVEVLARRGTIVTWHVGMEKILVRFTTPYTEDKVSGTELIIWSPSVVITHRLCCIA